MDDITGKLTDLLSDSDMLDKLKGLSGLLGLSENADSASAEPSERESTRSGDSEPDIFGMMMKIMPIVNAFSQEDETVRLLNALKPFLAKDRQKKLDSAIMLVRLMRIFPLLKESGLFGRIL